ncbi:MAG: hypothetical protein HOD63_01685 [Bacteroidetes bacterium]|nr:hypothetical protein [Bacteroidota bacterium]
MFRKFAFLLILHLFINQLTAQELTYRKINLNDYLGQKTVDELNTLIYHEALSGKIKAYKTDTLVNSYTIEELNSLGEWTDWIEVCPEPKYPNDCYDSTIVNEFRTDDLIGNLIAEKWAFDLKKKQIFVEYHSFALMHNLTYAGYALGEQPLFWIDLDDLAKILNPDELKLFMDALFNETLSFYNDFDENSAITKRLLSPNEYIGKFTFQEYNSSLYSAALNQDIPSYKTIALDSAYDIKALKNRGSKEYDRFYPDPEYPDYGFDTLYTKFWNPKEIESFIISEQIIFDKIRFSYKYNIRSIGLLYVTPDIQIDICYFAYTDLKKALKKYEISGLTKAIYNATVDQHKFHTD